MLCLCFSDELRQLRTEREELEKETERWKAEQTKERDKERREHRYVFIAFSFDSSYHIWIIVSQINSNLHAYISWHVLWYHTVRFTYETVILWGNLLRPITQITVNASATQVLCSSIKNVPADTSWRSTGVLCEC